MSSSSQPITARPAPFLTVIGETVGDIGDLVVTAHCAVTVIGETIGAIDVGEDEPWA